MMTKQDWVTIMGERGAVVVNKNEIEAVTFEYFPKNSLMGANIIIVRTSTERYTIDFYNPRKLAEQWIKLNTAIGSDALADYCPSEHEEYVDKFIETYLK